MWFGFGLSNTARQQGFIWALSKVKNPWELQRRTIPDLKSCLNFSMAPWVVHGLENAPIGGPKRTQVMVVRCYLAVFARSPLPVVVASEVVAPGCTPYPSSFHHFIGETSLCWYCLCLNGS